MCNISANLVYKDARWQDFYIGSNNIKNPDTFTLENFYNSTKVYFNILGKWSFDKKDFKGERCNTFDHSASGIRLGNFTSITQYVLDHSNVDPYHEDPFRMAATKNWIGYCVSHSLSKWGELGMSTVYLGESQEVFDVAPYAYTDSYSDYGYTDSGTTTGWKLNKSAHPLHNTDLKAVIDSKYPVYSHPSLPSERFTLYAPIVVVAGELLPPARASQRIEASIDVMYRNSVEKINELLSAIN
jgi:hypothetical protein